MNPARDELRQQLREFLKAKKDARVSYRETILIKKSSELLNLQVKEVKEDKKLSDMGYTIVSAYS